MRKLNNFKVIKQDNCSTNQEKEREKIKKINKLKNSLQEIQKKLTLIKMGNNS